MCIFAGKLWNMCVLKEHEIKSFWGYTGVTCVPSLEHRTIIFYT